MRILVIEDDRQIAEGLTHALRRSGHVVDHVGDGVAGGHATAAQEFDLIILDLGLPRIDGLSLLKNLRARGRQTPVLILTARDELSDRVRGLDLGADDYLVKPFELAELEARIRAITRRVLSRSGDADIGVGRLLLKSAERRIYADQVAMDFSPREFGLLEILLLRHGRVVSKAQIQDHLCDWSDEISESAIEIHVHRVRKKIEQAGVEIRTVRGFGYLLQAIDETHD